MANESYYAALDLGADSGRVILGHLQDGQVRLEEIHRFSNGPQNVQGHYYWNIQAIFTELKTGLQKAVRAGKPLKSLSVDSWGVDYILFHNRMPQLGLPFNYRDPRTNDPHKAVRERLGDEVIYGETGIQFLVFNTIYQLVSAKEETPELLNVAEKFLPVADYLNYLFCGAQKCEVSMASTTQLYNPLTRGWSEKLIKELDLPRALFPEICDSGTVLGDLLPEIADQIGAQGVKVVAGCSHDTGAAVAATPMETSNCAYLSSGTWSLMGTELPHPCITDDARRAGFTNEIGYGNSVRFLKNLIGMWILQECKRDWEKAGQDFDYKTLDRMAEEEAEPVRSLIHPNAARFLTPGNMLEKVRSYCRETDQPEPETPGQVVRCILESLALLYRATLQDLSSVTGQTIEKLHIVGGGSNSDLLNRWTANAAGIPVHAGPVEATGAGNILIQALAQGEISSLQELRTVVRNSFEINVYQPEQEDALATKGRERFEKLHLLD